MPRFKGYIDEECRQCDEYIRPFGCTNHHCTIYTDYKSELDAMAYDRKKDERAERLLEDENE
jgi:hypothetical protein